MVWNCKNLLYLLRKIWKYVKDEKYCKVRDHCHYTEYRGAAQSIYNLKYSVPKIIPIAFHNGLTMISFYHKKVRRRVWKTIHLFRRKHWKIHNLHSSNKKRSNRNW